MNRSDLDKVIFDDLLFKILLIVCNEYYITSDEYFITIARIGWGIDSHLDSAYKSYS